MHFFGRQVVGFSQGVNPSGKEGFIGIHVADSSDDTLVEKRCFYGDVMPAQSLPHNIRGKSFVQWLGTQLTNHSISIIHQPYQSQSAPVAENKAVPVGQLKNRPGIAVNLFGI
ncbi:unnamed protein product, partial [marine sediment metagenome]